MSNPSEGKGRALPVLHSQGAGAMDRRQALKVMAIAAATPTLSCFTSGDAGDPAVAGSPSGNPRAAGTAWDPDLLAPIVPWERSLSADELEALAALCDVIIPGDTRSPSASRVGAHDFIDEWVSAPYDRNQRDRVTVRGGLIWLDREATSRFGEGRRFRELDETQMAVICDDLCSVPDAAPEHEAGARFFARVRDLTAAAFWTTSEGMQDLQYVGNVALARWELPPPEVLRHIGLP